jgi:SAM-dependent MidA family methyltransferase
VNPADRLRRRIAESGPIPFATFMEEALYGEGGYYARQELPIGEAGDFVTGSSLSPLFGRATARLLRSLDEALGGAADYLEVGYGTGAHLAGVVEGLGGEAARRRLLAWDRVARPVPPGVRRLPDLEGAAPGELRGLLFSYELFDALPVHRLIGRPAGEADQTGELGELWVDLERGAASEDGAGRFVWKEAELSAPELARLPAAPLQPGQVAELAPGWRPLYRALADRLGAGLLVTFDYGFEGERLLDARVRANGTLACHRGHRVHRDPFRDPGREDLSAHVDFSALIEEGEAAGLATLAFTRQAPWLVACGLLEGLAEGGSPERVRSRIEAQQLLALDGMGVEIRVLIQGRGIDPHALRELDRLANA